MEQSARARRLLQCGWLSTDRLKLMCSIEAVAAALQSSSVAKATILRALSQFTNRVPQACSFFLDFLGCFNDDGPARVSELVSYFFSQSNIWSLELLGQ